jgi:anti-sigma factor RsiW
MSMHEDWVRQINAELDGELSLQESAGLARHLASCGACASARVSQLELRLALSRTASHDASRGSARPRPGSRRIALWVVIAIAVAGAGGWLAHARWGGPLRGSVESSRAIFVAQ